MSTQYSHISLDQANAYHIKLQGRIEGNWSDYLHQLAVQYHKQPDGGIITELCGIVADQASLHGLLNYIRDLGLPLLLVELQANDA